MAHVFVDALDERVEVEGRDGHHLQRVRRLETGERVTAADGTGAWRCYEIVGRARGALSLDARGPLRVEPMPRPSIAVAPALTKAGLDAVVAPLTELGVVRIHPVRAQRTPVRLGAERAGAVVERLRVRAREAAMQARRARIPEVDPVADLAVLAGRPDLVVAARDGVPADEVPPPASGTWTVLVGPEGGFAPGEVEALGAAARLAVGPHVLRAETAPVAAVAALLARTVAWM